VGSWRSLPFNVAIIGWRGVFDAWNKLEKAALIA
jgi:hypothetical protein